MSNQKPSPDQDSPESINFDCVVDAVGESCPMPLLRAKMQLNKMAIGETLKMLASDPGSQRDVQAFTSLVGHDLIDFQAEGSLFIYFITKRS